MSKKSKTVDLVLCEDGTYGTKTSKKNKTKQEVLATREKPKVFKDTPADEFLSGIDLSLDFIDKLVPRVERFMRLRG